MSQIPFTPIMGQSFMMIRPINDNEKTKYGSLTCDTNAMKLALKLEKLNPTVVIGYRTKTLPEEKTAERPHFVVIVKDKVWEIVTNICCETFYSISNKKEWFKYHGFEVKMSLSSPDMWKHYLKNIN